MRCFGFMVATTIRLILNSHLLSQVKTAFRDLSNVCAKATKCTAQAGTEEQKGATAREAVLWVCPGQADKGMWASCPALSCPSHSLSKNPIWTPPPSY